VDAEAAAAAAADTEAAEWAIGEGTPRASRKLRVRDLPGDTCFYLVRPFKQGTLAANRHAMAGLDPGHWAARTEEAGDKYVVISVAQIGGKVWERMFFRTVGLQPAAMLASFKGHAAGAAFAGAAPTDSPARLVSLTLQ